AKLEAGAISPAARETSSAGAKERPPTPLPPPESWCAPLEDSDLVCLDLRDKISNVERAPQRNVVPPNRGLVVRVLHDAGSIVQVQWGGERGLAPLPMVTVDGGLRTEALGPQPATSPISSFTFSPRRPGHADLEVTVSRSGSTTTYKLELEV